MTEDPEATEPTTPALYVIPCSAAKLDHPAPAGTLYTGSLHRLARQAADALAARHGGTVVIMSALRGLVDLDTVIEPYDVTIAKLHVRPGPGRVGGGGSLGLTHLIAQQVLAYDPGVVVGLVPTSYRDILFSGVIIAGLRGPRAATKVAPLADCSGIGYQRKRLAALRDGSDEGLTPAAAAA